MLLILALCAAVACARPDPNLQAANRDLDPDQSEGKLAAEEAWAVQIKAGMTGTVENNRSSTPVNNSTTTNVAPPSQPPPSPLDQSSTQNITAAANLTTPVSSPPPPANEEKSPPVHGAACDRGPVIAKLSRVGPKNGPQDFTLTVENAGKSKMDVTIRASDGWKATPGVMALPKQQNESVAITVTDIEAAKHVAKITISWSDGDCYVDVPAQVFADHSSFSLEFLNAPGAFALLLGGSLVFLLVLGAAGVWGCMSWRARARHGTTETKYQELEMALPATNDKQEDEPSPSADGWDEVWEDDDWQDSEAGRTSSSALTLSSAGLNSRRANKDGWDSTWDD
jgi:hypothetical protein